MEPKYFDVKKQSAQEFFDKYCLSVDPERSNFSDRNREKISAYHLMKDIIYLKNELKTEAGESDIRIILADESNMLRTKLLHTYVYKVEDYDSVSVKLTLQSFKVTVDDNK